MTQEEKRILLRDLCARVPYEVQCEYTSVQPGLEIHNEIGALTSIDVMHNNLYNFKIDNHLVGFSDFKPFLRPMSSMTEEEKEELKQEHIKDEKLYAECLTKAANGDDSMRGKVIPHFAADWCNKNHFDYRGLIPMGLALEAPADMYKS